jgi:hypothetical protein
MFRGFNRLQHLPRIYLLLSKVIPTVATCNFLRVLSNNSPAVAAAPQALTEPHGLVPANYHRLKVMLKDKRIKTRTEIEKVEGRIALKSR